MKKEIQYNMAGKPGMRKSSEQHRVDDQPLVTPKAGTSKRERRGRSNALKPGATALKIL